MRKRCCDSFDHDSNGVFRVCFALRANEFLGGDCNYEFIFGNPLCW